MFRPPYPALATDRVRWVGDYVAFVIADTVHHAMDAAELVEVEYDPLSAVTATADDMIPMGLRHATQPTEGVQFHPESILTTCGQTIIRNFAQAIGAAP